MAGKSKTKARKSTESAEQSLSVDNWPVEGAGFNVRVTNALRRAGVQTVGEVRTCEPLRLLSLRSFGVRSLENVRWFFQLTGQLQQGQKPITSFQQWLHDFLNPQERAVLEQRFGLKDPLFRPAMRQPTLDEIGKAMGGLTRERVRQIEEDGLRELRSRLSLAAIKPVTAHWMESVSLGGGAITAGGLKKWSQDPCLGRYLVWGCWLLYSQVDDRLLYRHGVFYTGVTGDQLEALEGEALNLLMERTEPLTPARMLALLDPLRLNGWKPGINQLTLFLQNHPQISGLKDGRYLAGLAGVSQVLAGILRAHGAPLHHSDLQRRYNALMDEASKKNTHYLVHCLGHSPVFRRVGNGIYNVA